MIVFIPGVAGFLGPYLARDLIQDGHTVIGLTRSQSKVDELRSIGVTPIVGDVSDFELLIKHSREADAIMYLAFPGFENIQEASQLEADAITAIGEAIRGTEKPLVVSGVIVFGKAAPNKQSVEDVCSIHQGDYPRGLAEIAVSNLAEKGVRVCIVRLPQVHDTKKQGLITFVTKYAKEKGVAAYIDDGQQKWAACHVSDTVRLYRLALERGNPGARYHAVAEEVTMKKIVEAIAAAYGLPVKGVSQHEAWEIYGYLSTFVGSYLDGSSKITQGALGWKPTGRSLIEDILAAQVYE